MSHQPVTIHTDIRDVVDAINTALANVVTTSTVTIGVTLSDSANLDSFGRLRVSNPVTVFEDKHIHGDNDHIWDYTTVGSGTATFLPDESTVELYVGTASGDIAQKCSRIYVPYSPGKSQLIEGTYVFGTGKANVVQQYGYFDSNDGIYFQETNGAMSWNIRSSVSGSVVETGIAQANWNIDTFDGNGDSGITLDADAGMIPIIDVQWLALGRVRVGFNINGTIHYVHEFLHANLTTEAYMSTGSLPVCFRIENTGVSASSTTMKTICTSVQSEGGTTPAARNWICSHGLTTVNVGTTMIPIMSIRPATTIGTKTNRRIVRVNGMSGFSEDKTAYFELKQHRGVTADNGTWAAVDNDSGTEVSLDLTSVTSTDAHVIDDTWAPVASKGKGASSDSALSLLDQNNTITLSNDGSQDQYFVLYAGTRTATSDVSGTINFKEYE